MKTTISLKQVYFRAFHGYYEEERIKGNDFYIDVSVTLADYDTDDDQLSNTVDYSKIYNICEEEMSQSKKLLETVVHRIIHRIKADFSEVATASVAISKMNPPLAGKVQASVVEMKF